MEENYQGVVEDPRSVEEKALDYKHEDLAMGEVVLNWIDLSQKPPKTFPIQNQDGSSSCVAQATAKILAMHEVSEGRDYTRLCPKFIYTRRANYPSGGMWLPNALSIACKHGACPETDMPCDNQGEDFMNNLAESSVCVLDAEKFKGKYYFEITDRSIDNIAKIIEQGYGVLLGFRFDYNEWIDVPFIDPNSQKSCGHGVAGIEYGTHLGEKAIMIDDSWGPGHGTGGKRIITESFLNARCFYAGYITSLPNFRFTLTLRYGSRNVEVRKLQEFLKLKVDGIFGLRTRLAVMAFQYKNFLIPDGIVGPRTRAKLNEQL